MNSLVNEVSVDPGYVYCASEPSVFYASIGSGVVVTLYDKCSKTGGMGYFFKPLRDNPKNSNPSYACPSIIGLVNFFRKKGIAASRLQANIIGGSENIYSPRYRRGEAAQNVKTARELLGKMKIPIDFDDTGGAAKTRKVAFNAYSGELLCARVNSANGDIWYPKLNE